MRSFSRNTILHMVSRITGVSVGSILGDSRVAEVARARHLAVLALAEYGSDNGVPLRHAKVAECLGSHPGIVSYSLKKFRTSKKPEYAEALRCLHEEVARRNRNLEQEKEKIAALLERHVES